MLEIIKRWYQGKFIPHENNDDGKFFVLGGGYYRRHWTAKLVYFFVEFFSKHGKWLLSTLLACLSLYVAVLQLG